MTTANQTCPYCRSPLDAEKEAKECPSCGTGHHADCWVENEGCAVVGCAAGPAAQKTAAVVLPPIEEPSAPVIVDVATEASGKGGRNWKRALVAAAAVLVVVAVGVGSAVAIRAGNKGGKIEVSEATSPASTSPSPPSTRTVNLAKRVDPSEFTDAEVVAGAKQVLLRHHELLKQANGDPSSPYAKQAWALLSARKQGAETAEGTQYGQSGFEFWITKREDENLRIGESVCLPGTVTLQSPGYWDPRNGVAMVYVDFGSYAGFTWVLYEHGRWTYDAGYGHVPSREATWGSRQDLLFQATGAESC